MPRKIKILVLAGGPSSEHEVSLSSAAMVMEHLDRKKYEPHLAVIGKNGLWKFGGGKPLNVGEAIHYLKRSKFDFVFIAMHGAFGEDGRMQGLLEWLGLPYSGSGVESSAVAMDKHVSNTLYRANRLSVPRYIVLDKPAAKRKLDFPLPFVVKPVAGGSSAGTSIVKKTQGAKRALKKAFREGDRLMVQQYIKGRELTCGVIEDKNGKAVALPPTEIIPRVASFFDYRAKYTAGGSLEITPPDNLAAGKIKELKRLALKAHRILGCRGMSRSDFILRGGTFYILETNTIPGMTRMSLLPQAARVAGIDFPSLLDLIIAAGFRRENK